MRKIWLLPFLFLLAACGAAGGGVPPESQQNTNSESPAAVEDAPADNAAVEPLNNDITIGATPAEASVVRDRDWTKGAADPLVTIIEYGDFQ